MCPPAHAFSFPEADLSAYRNDYRNALTVIVAEDPSRFLEQTKNGTSNPYTKSLNHLEHHQLRFLLWYYIFISLEGAGFGFLTRKYGDWSRYTVYEWFARKILLPRISEWQLLLTDFNFPKKPKRNVFVDVLTTVHLYRGRVDDYFLNGSGELSGIFMKEVARFRRSDYESALAKTDVKHPNKEDFWSEIPGSNFYIPADKITNLNVRFPYANNTDLK